MDKTDTPPARLSDRDLLSEVERLAACERQATAHLIALLAELDTRRLYLAEGCASLYRYCVERLRLSEHAAYHRIEAARTARRFPVVLRHLAEGTLTLTALTLLRPHLTEANCESLLGSAAGRSKRDVEILVRILAPLPEVRSSVRRLPGPRAAAAAGAADRTSSGRPEEPPRPAVVRPLSATRYSLHVTLSTETHAKLRRAQDLLRHAIPTGDPAAVLDRALTLLVTHLERKKVAAAKPRRPPPCAGRTRGPALRRSRHIPATVRRAVWARDEGRCAFVGTGGRCSETGLLELHHRVPFAEGGDATISNIELRCRSHNAHEARRWFGVEAEPFGPANRPRPLASEASTRPGPS